MTTRARAIGAAAYDFGREVEVKDPKIERRREGVLRAPKRGRIVRPHRFMPAILGLLGELDELVAAIGAYLDDQEWRDAGEALRRACSVLREPSAAQRALRDAVQVHEARTQARQLDLFVRDDELTRVVALETAADERWKENLKGTAIRSRAEELEPIAPRVIRGRKGQANVAPKRFA